MTLFKGSKALKKTIENMKESYEYDEDTLLSTYRIQAIFKGKSFVVEGYSKPHKDDLDFASSLTGIEIARLKALIKLLREIKPFTTSSLDQEQVEKSIEIIRASKEKYIDQKDSIYRSIEVKRSAKKEPQQPGFMGEMFKPNSLVEAAEAARTVFEATQEENKRREKESNK